MKTLADELNDALARQHILEGRQIALLRRDELLYWISSADDPIKKLMLELNLTDIQAKDILSLNLGYFKRLVALDVESELVNLQRNLSSNEQIARIRDISKPKQPQCRVVRSPVPDAVKVESDWLKACKFCEEKFGDLVIEDNNPLAFSEGIDMLYFYKKDYIEPGYLTKEKVTIDGIQYRVALCNNPIKACFVPMDTDIGHIRHCNSTLPMFDTNKKYHGVFSKDDYVPSNRWFNLSKGAKLVTRDGLESVEPGTMYRVIDDANYPDHINLLIRLPKYPYPDKDQRGKYV